MSQNYYGNYNNGNDADDSKHDNMQDQNLMASAKTFQTLLH